MEGIRNQLPHATGFEDVSCRDVGVIRVERSNWFWMDNSYDQGRFFSVMV